MNKNWTPLTLASTAILMTGYLYFRDTPIDTSAATTNPNPIVSAAVGQPAVPSEDKDSTTQHTQDLDEQLISQATSTLTRREDFLTGE